MKVYKADNSGLKLKKLIYVTKPFIGTSRIPRNGPCICGSGKKFKHCCWKLFVQESKNEKEISKM